MPWTSLASERPPEGVDLMVYTVNSPGYRWEGKSLPWLENAATVAEEKRLTAILRENTYVLETADDPDFNEDAPIRQISSTGRIR